ncbi:MAG: alpha/beta hydrolase [Alphaproteobacteria bacterium]
MISKSIQYILFLVFIFTPISVQAWGDKDKGNQWASTIVKKDIAYGSDDLQKLDVYVPRGTKALKPVLIFVHGGGWRQGDKKQYVPMGKFYADHGVVFVAVNYRLSPDVVHPAHVQDSAKAIKWIYDNIGKYGGDKNKTYLSGHSAGAHLSALIGTDPKYLAAHGLAPTIFKAVIPNDTASFDFLTPIQKGKIFVQPMIDQAFGTDPNGLKEASPITYARSEKDSPRFVIFVTAGRPDAADQTRLFHEALIQSGAKSEYHVIKGNSHRDMAKGMFDAESPISKEILNVIWGQ